MVVEGWLVGGVGGGPSPGGDAILLLLVSLRFSHRYQKKSSDFSSICRRRHRWVR